MACNLRGGTKMNETTLLLHPHRPAPIRALYGLGLPLSILFDRPYWGFSRDDFRNTPKYLANREMNGFGAEKTGLNRPYWIESVFPDGL